MCQTITESENTQIGTHKTEDDVTSGVGLSLVVKDVKNLTLAESENTTKGCQESYVSRERKYTIANKIGKTEDDVTSV